MPVIKYNSGPQKTKEVHDRIYLIDQIIFRRKHILRKDLLDAINRKLDEQISLETLDKDIKALKEHLDIKFEGIQLKNSKSKGYHYTYPEFSINQSDLSENDKSLLLLANNLFKQFRGTSQESKFEKIIHKIFESFDIYGDILIDKDDIGYYHPSTTINEYVGKWLDIILQSIFDKKAIEINYDSTRSKEKWRLLSPYVIRQHDSKWYLVAYDHSVNDFNEKVFLLSRIKDVRNSNEKYISSEFNAADYFRYSIGIWHQHQYQPKIVKFKVLYGLENIKNSPIHQTQKILKEFEDGSAEISIEVYNSPELKKLILSYGYHIKVLEPQEVVDDIISTIKKMQSLYLTKLIYF